MKETFTEIKGYIPDEYSEKDNVYGSGQTPNPIILESGNWKPLLIPDEFQNKNGFDTFGCVSFSILNAYEKLAKLQYDEDWNLSERFTYIVSDTIPGQGNSPREVAEAVRKLGVLAEKDLPFDELIDTIEKFNSPKPMDKQLLKEALKFLDDYIFRYDFLPLKGINDIKGDNEVFRDALKRSPISIAVYAWAERDGKYFRPNPSPETTLTLLVNMNGEEKEIFDSYAPTLKTLDKDFYIATALRFYLRKKTEEEKKAELQASLNLLQLALNWLATLIPFLKKKDKPIVRENPPVIDEVPPLRVSRIKDWAKIIEEFENAPKDWNNPGAIKGLNGNFLRFDRYSEGFDYLCDYLIRACTGRHRAYPRGGETTLKEFTYIYAPPASNPTDKYVSFVVSKLKVESNTKIKELL